MKPEMKPDTKPDNKMNLNMNLSLSSFDPKLLLPALKRISGPAVTLVIVLLVGYTAYQISRITSVQPDVAYMEANKKDHKTPSLKINQETMKQLKSLTPAGDVTVPVVTGKDDPFRL